MKNKKLSILLITLTTSIMIGCSNKISMEDKVIDSVVIDEDAKDTAYQNNDIEINKVLETEGFNIDEKNESMIIKNDRIIKIESYHNEEFIETQYPKLFIENLEVGDITNEINNEKKVIYWSNKDVNGQLIVDYMGYGNNFRVLKDNKVYILDYNYELKEIKAYENLLEEIDGDLNRFQASENGKLDLYIYENGIGIDKLEIIDIQNDNYYKITCDEVKNLTNKSIELLDIIDNKIYISINYKINSSNGDIKYVSEIGYFHNNKYYEVIKSNNNINVYIQGSTLINNNVILFSGIVQDRNGIWKYDMDKEELSLESEIEDGFISEFSINKEKNKILIRSIYANNNHKDKLSIGRINEKSEIYNLKNIISYESNDKFINDVEWNFEGDKITVLIKDIELADNGIIEKQHVEVYKIEN